MNEFQQYFHKIFPDLKSFSYALIPDDLQAQQLVIDSISVLLLQEKELIEKLVNEEKDAMDFHMFRIKIFLYKNIFKLAVKRIPQLESSIGAGEDHAAFYVIGVSKRATLFLQHKTTFDYADIQDILEKTKTEVISLLQRGRSQFIENLGLGEFN